MAQGVLTNPGSNDQNDLSDIKFTSPSYSEVSPVQLPIRGEKRIIPSFVNIETIQSEIDTGIAAGGENPDARSTKIDFDSFVTSAQLNPFVDYVVIRIPHRGLDSQGKSDPAHSATYRFLINPATVQVQRTTVDQQTLTRDGWQFSVWGEDILNISLQGQTAGQYFAMGLTDQFHAFTESYRNLQQLLMVFENNGYWFEGEAAGQGPLAADFTRRRIKMHQDVELVVGNYVWSGMFDTMDISRNAESPYNYDFTINFLAWKERYRTGSPYRDTLHNDIQRGHSYSAYQGAQALASIMQQVNQLPIMSLPINPPTFQPTQPNGSPQSPAVMAAQQDDFSMNIDPTAADTGYNSASAFFSTDRSQFS